MQLACKIVTFWILARIQIHQNETLWYRPHCKNRFKDLPKREEAR